jgi:single-strand DNA-binding protein
MNSINVVGRLGRDPESFNYNRGGEQMTGARFSVAVDKQGPRGGSERQPDWFNVSVFGGQAQPVLQYLKSGRQVAITGRMESNVQEKDGSKITYWGIVASDVQFLSDGTQGSGGGGGSQQPSQSTPDSDLGF